MRHWWQLGIRNWRAKPGRTFGAVLAIAIGVGVVIWVTCAYESVRLALSDQVWFWIGRSHLSVESSYGAQGTVYESIAEDARRLPNVEHVTYQLKHNMILQTRPNAGTDGRDAPMGLGINVQAIGIDPATEQPFRTYPADRIVGRMLTPEDTHAVVLDRQVAERLNLKIGDTVEMGTDALDPDPLPDGAMETFQIVGLMQHHRIAAQQRPVVLTPLATLQELTGHDREPRRVTKIDIMVKDTSSTALVRTERLLSQRIARYRQPFIVSNAQAKIAQVTAAENQTKFVLLLISTVALFTAFFIILSTLSMGMVERIGQLGTLRCLGCTRAQLAFLTLGEAAVLGTFGILGGIPIGLALGQLSVWLAPEYIGTFAISRMGLILALCGGAVTTLAGAALPMLQAFRVSPLTASRPQSRPPPSALTWIAGALGVAMILTHTWMIGGIAPARLYRADTAILAVALLYVGYALIVPVLIRIFSSVAVRLAALLLRMRYPLLRDQFGRAVWRSAAICCGLMVGLSLIVTLVVHSESLAAGWNFPKDFAEAFLYASPPIPKERADAARRIGGIKSSCLANTNIRCTIYGQGPFHFPVSLFIAGDPHEFFDMTNLTFLEGDPEEAIARLAEGNAVIVTPEFVRSKNRGYGDKVAIRQAALFGRGAVFEIVAVVTSPALDIAANYFNAGDMLMAQSVHVALGTFQDAQRVFQVPEEVSLILMDFDLPRTEPPPEFAEDFPPDATDAQRMSELLARWRPLLPERAAELDRLQPTDDGSPTPSLGLVEANIYRQALASVRRNWSRTTPEQRWRAYREELVMDLVAHRADIGWYQHGTVRGLKEQIDGELRRATQLFATIPIVALIVAALGVADLMTANVTSRFQQLATLRAIGATRWQIVRLIIGEALTLGVLGCGVGVALGLHAAWSIKTMIELLWGYRPVWTVPLGWLSVGIALTLIVCLIASILPARRAARSNIVSALQTT